MSQFKHKTVCALVPTTVLFLSVAVYAQQRSAPSVDGVEPEKDALSYITRDASIAAVAHPRRVLTDASMQVLPIEIFAAWSGKELGIDPLEVEEVVMIVEMGEKPPTVVFVVRFSETHHFDVSKSPLAENTVEAVFEGKRYRKGRPFSHLSLYMPDRRTLVVARDDCLRGLVTKAKQPILGSLSMLFKAADTSADISVIATMDPVREMLTDILSSEFVPPPLAEMKRIPESLKSIDFKSQLTDEAEAELVLHAVDATAAEELERLVNRLLEHGRNAILTELTQEYSRQDPIERATIRYMERFSQHVLDSLRPTREGTVVTLSLTKDQYTQRAVIGLVIAMMQPARASALEAARESVSRHNLKQIGLGIQNYHDQHGHLPPCASYDENGKPLLSWRVHILPYLDFGPLYEEFHLDEPWDSEHNRKLIPEMPSVFSNPNGDTEPNEADYMAPVGKGTIFGSRKPPSLDAIRDDTSKTIMIVEVDPDKSVVWTKPDDWRYSPDRPLSGLGKAHAEGFNVLFADGSVYFIGAAIDPAILRKWLLMADGEPVLDPSLLPDPIEAGGAMETMEPAVERLPGLGGESVPSVNPFGNS